MNATNPPGGETLPDDPEARADRDDPPRTLGLDHPAPETALPGELGRGLDPVDPPTALIGTPTIDSRGPAATIARVDPQRSDDRTARGGESFELVAERMETIGVARDPSAAPVEPQPAGPAPRHRGIGACRRSTATRSWASWAGAAWASSTRPARSA